MKISLRAARVDAGYTQKEAAKELGISKGTLASYENYQTSPDMTTATRIASMYARELSEISWTGDKAPSFLPSNRALSGMGEKNEAAL